MHYAKHIVIITRHPRPHPRCREWHWNRAAANHSAPGDQLLLHLPARNLVLWLWCRRPWFAIPIRRGQQDGRAHLQTREVPGFLLARGEGGSSQPAQHFGALVSLCCIKIWKNFDINYHTEESWLPHFHSENTFFKYCTAYFFKHTCMLTEPCL